MAASVEEIVARRPLVRLHRLGHMVNASPRVLIVAGDPLARAGLVALMTDQPEVIIVGQVAGSSDLSVELEAYSPDVLLWDLGLDTEADLEYLSELSNDRLPIVALLPDEAHAAEGWTAGARGLLFREADARSLVAAIVAVASGVVVLDPQLAAAVMAAGGRTPSPQSGGLTPRELDVLHLLAEGLPNKSIASRVIISEHTVKFHVNAILNKLGAQSRTEAVIQASRLGLLVL